MGKTKRQQHRGSAREETDGRESYRIVRLQDKSYSPVENPSPSTWRAIGRRIVVHFAMGQAF